MVSPQHPHGGEQRQDLRAEPAAQLPPQHPRVRPQALRRLPDPLLAADVTPAGSQAGPGLQGNNTEHPQGSVGVAGLHVAVLFPHQVV